MDQQQVSWLSRDDEISLLYLIYWINIVFLKLFFHVFKFFIYFEYFIYIELISYLSACLSIIRHVNGKALIINPSSNNLKLLR